MPKKAPGKKIKKILIAEDEQAIAKTLELKLRACGFDTTCASDGDEALAHFNKMPYDLVLLDLVMPRKDGFEVLATLKKQSPQTPVFVLTNLGQEEDEQRCKQLGAQEYFVKANVPLSDLVERIQKIS